MERVIPLVALLLSGIVLSGCDLAKTVKPDKALYSENSGAILLGPESFPFCGGWVELWSQVEPFKGTRLFIKLSPPPQKSWHVWNAQVVIESPDEPNHLLRFTEMKDFNTADERTNVAVWNVDVEEFNPAHGLKVALRPFEGCAPEQKMYGVVLKSNLRPTP